MAFTVLNCGTSYHRGKKGELIADLGELMDGEEYKHFLINDGPGSNPPGGTFFKPGKYQPGRYDPFTRQRAPKQSDLLRRKKKTWSKTPMKTMENFVSGRSPTDTARRVEQEWLAKRAKTAEALSEHEQDQLKKAKAKAVGKQPGDSHRGPAWGGVHGDGWDDNIRRTIATLGEACLPDPHGTGYGGTGPAREITARATVNMIGWSRGAVTCIRIANWAEEFLGGGIKFNIFAVDPVAGLDAGVKLWDTQNVPGNVLNLVVILALDDKGSNFRPQDRDRLWIKPGTRRLFLPFPGLHGTAVEGGDRVAQLVRHLAAKFLSTFPRDDPSKFKNNNPPTIDVPCWQLEMYAGIQLERDRYLGMWDQKSLKGKLVGGSRKDRKVFVHAQDYVSGDIDLFVNEHHRACLAKAYPLAEQYLFTQHVDAGRALEDFKKMRTGAPKTTELMQKALPGFSVDATGTNWTLPHPGAARSADLDRGAAFARELV
jgi:hypothetical protein